MVGLQQKQHFAVFFTGLCSGVRFRHKSCIYCWILEFQHYFTDRYLTQTSDLHLARGRRLPNLEERSIEKLFLKAELHFHQFGDYSEVLAHGFENYHSPHWNKDQDH